MNASNIGTEVRVALRQVPPATETMLPGVHRVDKVIGISADVIVGNPHKQRQPNTVLTKQVLALVLSQMSPKQGKSVIDRITGKKRNSGLFARKPKDWALEAVESLCANTVRQHKGRVTAKGLISPQTVP